MHELGIQVRNLDRGYQTWTATKRAQARRLLRRPLPPEAATYLVQLRVSQTTALSFACGRRAAGRAGTIRLSSRHELDSAAAVTREDVLFHFELVDESICATAAGVGARRLPPSPDCELPAPHPRNPPPCPPVTTPSTGSRPGSPTNSPGVSLREHRRLLLQTHNGVNPGRPSRRRCPWPPDRRVS